MITIDAQNKTLGRVASAAAKALMGKHKVSFVRHNTSSGEEVTIVNASKVAMSGTKEKTVEYIRYTGYPGGQRKEPYAMLTKRRGYGEAIRRAVKGMLPKNKLQTERLKMLKITE